MRKSQDNAPLEFHMRKNSSKSTLLAFDNNTIKLPRLKQGLHELHPRRDPFYYLKKGQSSRIALALPPKFSIQPTPTSLSKAVSSNNLLVSRKFKSKVFSAPDPPLQHADSSSKLLSQFYATPTFKAIATPKPSDRLQWPGLKKAPSCRASKLASDRRKPMLYSNRIDLP